MTETEISINEAESWVGVERELAAAAGDRIPTTKLLCTACVLDIECGSVCVIP